MRPRLLDLFCGVGGAGVGYYQAGFEVVGIDIVPQPRYPFRFWQLNVFDLEPWVFDAFDVIHASPPCQRWASSAHWHNGDGDLDYRYPDLITPLRPILEAARLPYVIENVTNAPLRLDVILCGSAFGLEAGGFEVRRHRAFELGRWQLGSLVPPCSHALPAMPIFGHTPNAEFYERYGEAPGADLKREAMGIGWANRDEVAEAIPPAFTEFVGARLLDQLFMRAAA